MQVDGLWLFDRADLEAYVVRAASGAALQRRLPVPRVDTGPLLRQIEFRGGDSAVGVRDRIADKRALERARHDGTLTIWATDRLAVRLLGLTPLELWGHVPA